MSKVGVITGGCNNSTRHYADFYPTPKVSTISLCESGLLPKDINSILEPCAGDGAIIDVLKEYYPKANIKAYDLYDYGHPNVIPNVDFLQAHIEPVEWVITNPPYNKKLLLPFVYKSLDLATKGVAMFLKITFYESVSRNELFERKDLKYVLAFANRQPVYKNGIPSGSSNAIMYAWFIWEKDYKGDPILKRIDNSELVKKGIK